LGPWGQSAEIVEPSSGTLSIGGGMRESIGRGLGGAACPPQESQLVGRGLCVVWCVVCAVWCVVLCVLCVCVCVLCVLCGVWCVLCVCGTYFIFLIPLSLVASE